MIIGLGHVARVGKDSVANVLVEEHGFTRLAFADELKRLALEINPIIDTPNSLGHTRLRAVVDTEGWERAKHLHPEVRVFLQHLGVACRKVLNDGVWVNRVVDRIYDNAFDNFVITDVRFPNECSALKSFKHVPVHLVRVNRPGHEASGHVSETALKGYAWDYELDNNGTLDDLGYSVERMLDAFSTAAQPA